jgi:hypothetical protein
MQHLPRHRVRVRAGQEHIPRPHLCRLARAVVERDLADTELLDLLARARRRLERGHDRAGREPVHADALRRELHGERAREGDDRALRGGVVDCARASAAARARAREEGGWDETGWDAPIAGEPLYAVMDVVLMMLAPRFMCASAYFVTAKYCARVSPTPAHAASGDARAHLDDVRLERALHVVEVDLRKLLAHAARQLSPAPTHSTPRARTSACSRC